MKLKKLEQLKNATILAPINFAFGGVDFKFDAKIKLVPEAEMTKLVDGSKKDDAIVRELLTGWDNFVDDGTQVAFSNDVLNELLSYGAIAGRLSIECVNAQYRVQEKN
ncbi:hypothetical protein CTT31_20805 [Pseudoalteromonas maricaloris]|uniref:hypothetical protein n=1 Tax=Pseudoalteromonas maricaloris TaxID=184924 RepID=UPI0021ADE149|nr:hypothetical protein [Pseudoalteromonas flavipulchra]USE71526.1 hypothetical protein CTT31_20805 [Pseudoalteromonas flavipulchra]